jgi:hypothetical protein
MDKELGSHPAPTRTSASRTTSGRLLTASSLLAAVAVLAGGYGLRWSWTGFSNYDHVWDVLQVVVLPAVLASLPLWYRTRSRFRTEWKAGIALVLVAFGILVLGGYGLGWTWTGFQGNTLWDWLELLALPVVLACLPAWFESRASRRTEWRVVLAFLACAFALVIAGGYGMGWAWTGFEGNTLWDWIHLFLMPFVLPASLAWYAGRVEETEREPVEQDARPVNNAAREGPLPGELADSLADGQPSPAS